MRFKRRPVSVFEVDADEEGTTMPEGLIINDCRTDEVDISLGDNDEEDDDELDTAVLVVGELSSRARPTMTAIAKRATEPAHFRCLKNSILARHSAILDVLITRRSNDASG